MVRKSPVAQLRGIDREQVDSLPSTLRDSILAMLDRKIKSADTAAGQHSFAFTVNLQEADRGAALLAAGEAKALKEVRTAFAYTDKNT